MKFLYHKTGSLASVDNAQDEEVLAFDMDDGDLAVLMYFKYYLLPKSILILTTKPMRAEDVVIENIFFLL